ncbi:hypothetical protein ACFL58_00315 [Elusimicrobiota bacterium]
MFKILFFISGFVAIVTQTLLLREMLVVFQGNELTIGLMLSNWLLGTAVGSYVAATYPFGEKITERDALSKSFVIAFILFIVSFFLTRNIRNLFQVLPGEGISLIACFIMSLFIYFPLSFIMGSQFSTIVSWAKKEKPVFKLATCYLWESAGCLAGGVIFTFILIHTLIPFAIVILICTVCLWALYMVTKHKNQAVISLIVFIFLAPFLTSTIEKYTFAEIFQGYKVEKYTDSFQGKISSAVRDDEKVLFSNGVPQISLPNIDTASAEEFGHLSLLFHPNPKSVILIGGSGKYISTILDHKVKKLHYLETDPAYLEFLYSYWPKEAKYSLSDPRIQMSLEDGRSYLKKYETKYDVILIGLSYPLTLSLNRFYTYEFFNLAKSRLLKNGIVAFTLPGSSVYVDKYQARLNNTILNTLQKVFKHTDLIPGETNLFIGSDSPIVAPSVIKDRLKKLRLDTKYLSSSLIDYKLNLERKNILLYQITSSVETAINKDFSPNGMLKALLYWQSIFSPHFTLIYKFFVNYSLIIVVVILFLLSLSKVKARGTAFSSGFAGMSLQMISILALQIISGNIYYWIGVLSAFFMIGSSLGAWTMQYRYRLENENVLLKTEIIFCVWIILWWILIKYSLVNIPLLFVLSAGSGYFVGFEFPIISSIMRKQTYEREASIGGKVYSADVLGAWFASVLAGTLLIPAWGIEKTIICVVILKIITLKWLVLPSFLSRNKA